MLQRVAACCSVLQCDAVCCSVLQCVATCCNTLQHTATHCNTPCTAFPLGNCYTLQHAATHCNMLQHTLYCIPSRQLLHTATCCNTLQHTATCCNTPCTAFPLGNCYSADFWDTKAKTSNFCEVSPCYTTTQFLKSQLAATFPIQNGGRADLWEINHIYKTRGLASSVKMLHFHTLSLNSHRSWISHRNKDYLTDLRATKTSEFHDMLKCSTATRFLKSQLATTFPIQNHCEFDFWEMDIKWLQSWLVRNKTSRFASSVKMLYFYTQKYFYTLWRRVLQCVLVCCRVLQCVAVCCSVLQWVAVWCSVLQCVAYTFQNAPPLHTFSKITSLLYFRYTITITVTLEEGKHCIFARFKNAPLLPKILENRMCSLVYGKHSSGPTFEKLCRSEEWASWHFMEASWLIQGGEDS